MNKLIAVVDDEQDILKLVSINLKKAGFNVREFSNAEGFLKFINKNYPDLIILDLMLPDADGFEICKYLKKQDKYSSIPVIMLTAKADEVDKVLGLEIGADDYVTKPFSPRELVARVKVVLRRKDKIKSEDTEKNEIADSLVMDMQRYKVMVNGKDIDTTTTEFKILQLLASKKSWVFTREQILNHLWGNEKAVLDRTIDVHIRNLRKKLGKAGRFIKNMRGIGYKFEE